VVTDDDDLANSCRAMRNFGFTGEGEVSSLGINGKMNEVEAVIGVTSLEHIDEIIETNRSNYLEYRRELKDIPGLRLMSYAENEKNNYQYVVVEVGEDAGVNLGLLHTLLQAEGILARRYFHPGCHRLEPYRTLYPMAPNELPRTLQACSSVLCLPTGTAVEAGQIRAISSLLRYAIRNSAEIWARWKR